MSRRSATVLAWALCGLSYALVGAFVWLEVLHHRTLGSSEFLFDGSIALVGVFFPGVGAFLASRRGENPICWLMIVIGLSLAASAPAHAYSQWGPLLGTSAPRFGQWVACDSCISWSYESVPPCFEKKFALIAGRNPAG